MALEDDLEIQINKPIFLTYVKVFMLIYWIPVLGAWWYKTYMSRLVYRMTDDYLVCEQGVFFYSKKKVPFVGIREVSIFRNPIAQLFGGYIVQIHTAGQNVGWPEIVFICPSDPDELVEEISQRVVQAKKKTVD